MKSPFGSPLTASIFIAREVKNNYLYFLADWASEGEQDYILFQIESSQLLAYVSIRTIVISLFTLALSEKLCLVYNNIFLY